MLVNVINTTNFVVNFIVHGHKMLNANADTNNKKTKFYTQLASDYMLW